MARYDTGRENSITISDEVFEKLTEVMIEYKCESIADAVAAASAVAREHDEAPLAQLLAQRIAE